MFETIFFTNWKKKFGCSRLFLLIKYNIEKAKNKSPSTKVPMGFISFWGAIFFWGA